MLPRPGVRRQALPSRAPPSLSARRRPSSNKPLSASPSDKTTTLTLKVTVGSIERGTLADFNGIQLNANQKAGIPEYVKVRLTNLGPGAMRGSDASVAVEGVDNTGQTEQSVTFIGDFPRCPDNESNTPLSSGQSFETCLTFLVPGGITKVAYSGTNSYIDSPVTWAAK
jgi:hypothetical protein